MLLIPSSPLGPGTGRGRRHFQVRGGPGPDCGWRLTSSCFWASSSSRLSTSYRPQVTGTLPLGGRGLRQVRRRQRWGPALPGPGSQARPSHVGQRVMPPPCSASRRQASSTPQWAAACRGVQPCVTQLKVVASLEEQPGGQEGFRFSGQTGARGQGTWSELSYDRAENRPGPWPSQETLPLPGSDPSPSLSRGLRDPALNLQLTTPHASPVLEYPRRRWREGVPMQA